LLKIILGEIVVVHFKKLKKKFKAYLKENPDFEGKKYSAYIQEKYLQIIMDKIIDIAEAEVIFSLNGIISDDISRWGRLEFKFSNGADESFFILKFSGGLKI